MAGAHRPVVDIKTMTSPRREPRLHKETGSRQDSNEERPACTSYVVNKIAINMCGITQ